MLCISWLIVNHERLTTVSHEGLTLKCHEGHFRITSQQTWGQRYQRLRAHVDDCISIALFTLILFYDMRFIILSILIIHCGLWVLGLLWHIFIVSIDGDYIMSSFIYALSFQYEYTVLLWARGQLLTPTQFDVTGTHRSTHVELSLQSRRERTMMDDPIESGIFGECWSLLWTPCFVYDLRYLILFLWSVYEIEICMIWCRCMMMLYIFEMQ